MVKIKNHRSEEDGPFTIVIIDAVDADYFADLFDEDRMEPISTQESFAKAKAIADALFVLKNNEFDSFEEMIEEDSGIDIRVYNGDHDCVYAAHQTFMDKWIGE